MESISHIQDQPLLDDKSNFLYGELQAKYTNLTSGERKKKELSDLYVTEEWMFKIKDENSIILEYNHLHSRPDLSSMIK